MISCGDVEERQEARRFILDLLIGFDDDDDDEGREGDLRISLPTGTTRQRKQNESSEPNSQVHDDREQAAELPIRRLTGQDQLRNHGARGVSVEYQ